MMPVDRAFQFLKLLPFVGDAVDIQFTFDPRLNPAR
jgi:hypothetical protein